MREKGDSMDTYRVDVKSILDSLGESIQVADTLQLDVLEVGDEHFSLREPIRFDVRLINTGTGIVGMGTVVAPVLATCARCLCEFPTDITAEVDGFYVETGKSADLPEEQEVELLDVDGFIDILPSVMAALVLEAPFAPLHDEECAGICVECGTDLNTGTCTCADAPGLEHPFAALKTLLAEKDPDSE